MNKGFFISLEGGEGAGKSTQHKHIVDWLAGQGKTVVEAREPGGTVVSEQIRQVLLDTRNAGLRPDRELRPHPEEKDDSGGRKDRLAVEQA